MSEEKSAEKQMAECGACRAIVPIDCEICPSCGVKFGGVSDETLGECGACGALQPIDSTSCSECGVSFVSDDVIDVMSGWLSSTGITIHNLFSRFDSNNDGIISSEEFREGLLSLKLADLPPSQVERLVNAIDEDGNGSVEISELSHTFGQEYIPEEHTTDEEIVEDTTEDELIEAAEEVESVTESEEEDSTEEVESESEEEESDEEEEEATEEVESEEEEEESTDADDESEQEESTEEDEESEEEEEESEEEEEESEEEEEESEEEEEEEEDLSEEQIDPEMILKKLARGIIYAGMTPKTAFDSFDLNSDGVIDGPELQKAVKRVAGTTLSDSEVSLLIKRWDSNPKDGAIDPSEFVNALEEATPTSLKMKNKKKVGKNFPTPLQSFLMGKTANDAVYPIVHFLMITFIGLWVVNGLGILVDGSGGPIVYEGHTDEAGFDHTSTVWDLCTSDMENIPDPCTGTVSVGELYPCVKEIDPNGCKNSLTPFSGESSSMPAGFYLDGIIMMVLGIIGLSVGLWLHLVHAPALREVAKGQSKGNDDEEDSDDDDDEDSDDDDDEDSDDDDDEDSDDDDDEDSDDDDDEDSEDEDDDAIDVGDWVGLEVDDEEYFGEIVEFDDDNGTVTIETEDGDEVTGDQDDMFMDEDDDE